VLLPDANTVSNRNRSSYCTLVEWSVYLGYSRIRLSNSPVISPEVRYRYLYDDFPDESPNDFLYQLSLNGVQITAGINF
jgi:hypothetical protein